MCCDFVIKASSWSPVPQNDTFLFSVCWDETELELILRMNNTYKLLPWHRITNWSSSFEFLNHTKQQKPRSKLNIYYFAPGA